MRDFIKASRAKLMDLFQIIEATDESSHSILLEEALENTINMIMECSEAGGKLIFIGNGGSAAIASHMATDFWKNGGIKATSFNDSVLLTCISNDHGYKHVFEKPMDMFAESKDILIAISSSGQSENILRGVFAAQEKQMKIVTFSGFKADNLLRAKGDINFYVPSSEYGHVEVLHHSLCHTLIDTIILNQPQIRERVELHEEI